MTFYDYAKKIILERLENRISLSEIIDKIKEDSAKGLVAFYPCGTYSRSIIAELRKKEPHLLEKILGCFDKSSEARMGADINVFSIDELERFQDKISLLIVTSNTYISKEKSDLKKLTAYDGAVFYTSQFESTIPDMDSYQLLERINSIYASLDDQKSKTTYLLVWLSKLLNDESITSIFDSEKLNEDYETNNTYKGYVIEGLDDICAQELKAELYKMRYVGPEPGDVVFDIGGYKGDTAIYFAHHVGKTGKVYSFEPIKANYDLLVKNAGENNFSDIIEPVNKACSRKTGHSKAVSAKSGSPWAFLSEAQDADDVQTVSIDDFVKSNHIENVDFIKMDVEGFENEALAGARETIKRFKPKLAICLYHKTSDLVDLPEMIQEVADYKMYVRCKMEGPYSVNLHCVKREA